MTRGLGKMADSIDVIIGRMDERLKVAMEDRQHDRTSRKELYDSVEGFRMELRQVADRVTTVENTLTKQTPTIEEFITIKTKVVGAGRFGKWLWAVGAGLISLIAYFRQEIGMFLIGGK